MLRLVYGEASFLLTGDLGSEGEESLLDGPSDLRATVLKVGHHGSDGSTTPAFLDAVSPSIAVISAGVENTFGHPSPTTRLRLAGVPLLRTDENGDVRFETDGADGSKVMFDSDGAATGNRWAFTIVTLDHVQPSGVHTDDWLYV